MEKLQKTRRKVRPIARKRHNFIYLLLAILLAILTVYLFINFPPDYKFQIPALPADRSNFGVPILPIFLVSLTGFIFSTLTFIFIQKTQGIIIASFILIYLSLRLISLTHWLFLTLVIALFITVELLIVKKK